MERKHSLLQIIKRILLVLLAFIALLLLGINESMYLEVNGTKQWINMYGEDLENPVLLYLHGGPGSSTSDIDYAFTRKWADVYTVVTWDQRNCGKSYGAEQNDIVLTREYFEEVNAPYKQLFLMENMTHGLLESDSEGFSQIVHQIAQIERERSFASTG